MDVIVDSDQITRIGFNILNKIYGPIKKHRGILFSFVYVDGQDNPRIAIHDPIFYPKTLLILKEDYLKFKSVIPLDEIRFSKIFELWLETNYGIKDFAKLTTTYPEKMRFVPEYRKTNSNPV